MSVSFDSTSAKRGMPPGTLVHVGDVTDTDAKVTVLDYTKSSLDEHAVESINEISKYKETDSVTWINIEGIHNIANLEFIGTEFNIHPLVLEDLANTHQRTKLEEFEDYLFVVLKRIRMDEATNTIMEEQISLLILNGFVFTFREVADDLFEPIVRRLKEGKGRMRNQGVDYLAYSIIDLIVDEYFQLQDELDEFAELLEDELLNNPSPKTLATIQKVKREMIYIRKSISPMREVLSGILRSETPLIDEKTKLYLRDVYDHVIRVNEAMESYRDLIAGMLDIYLSSVSNRLNETMKVLTVFSTIFIPLTFITGIYGMNFEFMPELKWHWAYPSLWILFVFVTGGLLLYFRRKKWI